MCQFTSLLTEHFDLVEEHVFKNFEGQLRCQMQNPFTSHPTKIKGIALAGHMKLWIMESCYFCGDFYFPCDINENHVCNVANMAHWYSKDQSKFWGFLKFY